MTDTDQNTLAHQNDVIDITLLLKVCDGITMRNVKRADEEIYRQADKEVVNAITEYRKTYSTRGEDYERILLRTCLNFAIRLQILKAKQKENDMADELTSLEQELETYLNQAKANR